MFWETLTVAPPEAVKLAVCPLAAPICRPELLLSALFGLVNVRVPAVENALPAWTLSWLKLPPPVNVNGPAEVLDKLFPPPVTAPPNVKPPVPAPVTVVLAARLTGADTSMLPALATVMVGVVPVKFRGLPAIVTVPAVLLIV